MKTIQLSKLKPKTIGFKKVKHKKRLVFILVLLIIAGFIANMFLQQSVTQVSDYSELSKDDLINNINTLGTVESNNTVNVYSTLNNTIKEVNVEEGDTVNEGDILCILDSTAIEQEIKESNEAINIDKSKAKIDMEIKKQAYDDVSYIYNNNINTEINDNEEALNTAKIKFDDAKRNYDKKKTLFDSGAATQSELDEVKVQLDTAQSDYNKSKIDLENAKVKAKQEVDNARNEYESAVVEYNNNKDEIVLQGKKDDLEKCVITAPASGTITTVNAKVGNSSNGILFTIEDLSDPIVSVDIKEVDINKVQIGQSVEVTTDATPDGEFASGKIISISDAVNTSENVVNSGNSDNNNTKTSSKFEGKIKLDNPLENDFIKVGMSAKANIILEKRENVFAIPFTSILEEDDGKYIKLLKENEDGTYTVSKTAVVTGMETDISVEIESADIQEGDKIVSDPNAYEDGEIVQVMQNNEENSYE